MTDSAEFKRAEALLASLGILEEVNNNKTLSFIAKELVASGDKDKDSIIYRLAMTIFHSERSGPSCLKALENPFDTYIKISEDASFQKDYPEFLAKMKNKPTPAIELVMKTFMCFAAAAYLYFKALGG